MKELPPFGPDGDNRPVASTAVIDPEEVSNSGIQACVAYWDGRRAGAFAPRWEDFHLYELPSPVLPYILVLDVLPDGDFRYRYWGSGHTLYHNRDYTGKRVSEMENAWAADLLRQQYGQVIEVRRPLVFVNSYEGVDIPLHSLRMPLSDDGKNVTHLISYVGRRAVTEIMRRLFEQDKGA